MYLLLFRRNTMYKKKKASAKRIPKGKVSSIVAKKKRKRRTPIEKPLQESEQIVEFSYNPQHEQIVARFLNGDSFLVKITSLPKKLQSKHPNWDRMQLFIDRSRLLVTANNSELREIPSKLIRQRGSQI